MSMGIAEKHVYRFLVASNPNEYGRLKFDLVARLQFVTDRTCLCVAAVFIYALWKFDDVQWCAFLAVFPHY
jgi:hypothetical protein